MARIRARFSAGVAWSALTSVSFSPSRSCGFTRYDSGSSTAAPVNSLSTSAPALSVWVAMYSFATRFMPSRSGVTVITSAARKSAATSARSNDWFR